MWQGETQTSYQLSQELLGHVGFVTSVGVTVDGTKVISADSQGSLRIYDVEDSRLARLFLLLLLTKIPVLILLYFFILYTSVN